MSQHPITLGLRFMLEMAALLAMGYWGWTQHAGLLRVVWMIGVPLVAAVIWGTFISPKAPVTLPGVIQLLIEFVVFGTGAWALWDAGRTGTALIFVLLVVIQYGLAYDRVTWLVRNRPPPMK